MLTVEPTEAMIQEWKKIYRENRGNLKPNRKSGKEVDEYFRLKYLPQEFISQELSEIVKNNILLNDFYKAKLPNDKNLSIVTYGLYNNTMLVGIDLVTGFFHIESEEISKMASLYDDLFVFRGLDESDLDNFFLVAQYIQCLER